MTNKEAIEIAKQLAYQYGEVKDIDAIQHLIDIAKRFEGAMPVHWASSAHPNNVKNYENDNSLYSNQCKLCNDFFLGHKHRRICKQCYEKAIPKENE